jgi:hypothetical protein
VAVYDARHDDLPALELRFHPARQPMILFPAMLVGGHLMIAVVDKVPDLNFEPICRDAAGEQLGIKDNFATCIQGEKTARNQLAAHWGEFDSADRARCIRLSTLDRAASYIEVLTCLELERDAKKLRRTTHQTTPQTSIAIDAPARSLTPAPETAGPPTGSARLPPPAVSAPPPPLSLAPQGGAATGLLQILCVPGLKSILPACISSGGRP